MKEKTLSLTSGVFQEMLEAARLAAPLEACGLLAGSGARATKFYALTNADASAEHFSMLPAEQFAALKEMRLAGLKLLGLWHSHPASSARMSLEDIRLAYTPDLVYVIISLAGSGAPRIGAFLVREEIAYEIPVIVEAKENQPL